MKKTHCDFCGRIVEEGGICFGYKKRKFRIDISIIGVYGNRVRSKRTDACAVCTFKYAVEAAEFLLKLKKRKRK